MVPVWKLEYYKEDVKTLRGISFCQSISFWLLNSKKTLEFLEWPNVHENLLILEFLYPIGRLLGITAHRPSRAPNLRWSSYQKRIRADRNFYCYFCGVCFACSQLITHFYQKHWSKKRSNSQCLDCKLRFVHLYQLVLRQIAIKYFWVIGSRKIQGVMSHETGIVASNDLRSRISSYKQSTDIRAVKVVISNEDMIFDSDFVAQSSFGEDFNRLTSFVEAKKACYMLVRTDQSGAQGFEWLLISYVPTDASTRRVNYNINKFDCFFQHI